MILSTASFLLSAAYGVVVGLTSWAPESYPINPLINSPPLITPPDKPETLNLRP